MFFPSLPTQEPDTPALGATPSWPRQAEDTHVESAQDDGLVLPTLSLKKNALNTLQFT